MPERDVVFVTMARPKWIHRSVYRQHTSPVVVSAVNLVMSYHYTVTDSPILVGCDEMKK